MGKGSDKFVYSVLGKSLAAKYDTIKDFVSGTDKIVVSSAQKSAIDTQNTGLITVDGASATGANLAAKLASALTGQTMLASGAAVVKLDSGTYLVLNDDATAFNATLDEVIKIESTGGAVTILSTDFIAT